MRLRANEREGYIYQLARERIDLQSKLGELQSLVVALLGERNMLHSYETAATVSTPAAATPAASPSALPPAKRHRRTRNAHSHDAGADGMSFSGTVSSTAKG